MAITGRQANYRKPPTFFVQVLWFHFLLKVLIEICLPGSWYFQATRTISTVEFPQLIWLTYLQGNVSMDQKN